MSYVDPPSKRKKSFKPDSVMKEKMSTTNSDISSLKNQMASMQSQMQNLSHDSSDMTSSI